MSAALLTIKAVAERTGLSAHVIRVWEKRYGAVAPARTGTNRRLYSDDEVQRLLLLKRLTGLGRSIGTIAVLPTEDLRSLSSEAGPDAAQPAPPSAPAGREGRLLADALAAVERMDAGALDEVLRKAEISLGIQGMLQRVAAPFTQVLGDHWREGRLSAAHEHFASAVLRTHLAQAARPFAPEPGAPCLVACTPAGQLHELGALLASATAANLGWNVIYLGASLPAHEIAGAATRHGARAVALSLVYPEDDAQLPREIARLREALPSTVALLAGGRAAPAYREALDKAGAATARDLLHLSELLDQLRRPSSTSS